MGTTATKEVEYGAPGFEVDVMFRSRSCKGNNSNGGARHCHYPPLSDSPPPPLPPPPPSLPHGPAALQHSQPLPPSSSRVIHPNTQNSSCADSNNSCRHVGSRGCCSSSCAPSFPSHHPPLSYFSFPAPGDPGRRRRGVQPRGGGGARRIYHDATYRVLPLLLILSGCVVGGIQITHSLKEEVLPKRVMAGLMAGLGGVLGLWVVLVLCGRWAGMCEVEHGRRGRGWCECEREGVAGGGGGGGGGGLETGGFEGGNWNGASTREKERDLEATRARGGGGGRGTMGQQPRALDEPREGGQAQGRAEGEGGLTARVHGRNTTVHELEGHVPSSGPRQPPVELEGAILMSDFSNVVTDEGYLHGREVPKGLRKKIREGLGLGALGTGVRVVIVGVDLGEVKKSAESRRSGVMERVILDVLVEELVRDKGGETKKVKKEKGRMEEGPRGGVVGEWLDAAAAAAAACSNKGARQTLRSEIKSQSTTRGGVQREALPKYEHAKQNGNVTTSVMNNDDGNTSQNRPRVARTRPERNPTRTTTQEEQLKQKEANRHIRFVDEDHVVSTEFSSSSSSSDDDESQYSPSVFSDNGRRDSVSSCSTASPDGAHARAGGNGTEGANTKRDVSPASPVSTSGSCGSGRGHGSSES
ncbi:hypothetical protein MKZ38_008954 [Zalerion maritima]|uniref:Uncharacterized protein n=1 Tax=Zalerion maritima TaxID=339359 RepID=A0AAD5RUY9_9PEZI|nr:hypothetical protein MKZ38_008954 [Zalerion maritima]